jgi:hypothetical protein
MIRITTRAPGPAPAAAVALSAHRPHFERYALWIAPLLTAGLLVLSTLVMFVSHGNVALY